MSRRMCDIFPFYGNHFMEKIAKRLYFPDISTCILQISSALTKDVVKNQAAHSMSTLPDSLENLQGNYFTSCPGTVYILPSQKIILTD